MQPLLSRHARVLAPDWRGHGASDAPEADFTAADLVSDALAVIEAAGVHRVVPVAVSHAGWVAIELRRRAGPDRLPGLVLLDWILLDPPAEFLGALGVLQDPTRWREMRDRLFDMWLGSVDQPEVRSHLHDVMGGYGAESWGRAGREIAGAYARFGAPLGVLKALAPPPPTLHIYAQPRDPAWLEAQQAFAKANPWFSVLRLDAATHFPAIETPAAVAEAVVGFAGRLGLPTVARGETR